MCVCGTARASMCGLAQRGCPRRHAHPCSVPAAKVAQYFRTSRCEPIFRRLAHTDTMSSPGSSASPWRGGKWRGGAGGRRGAGRGGGHTKAARPSKRVILRGLPADCASNPDVRRAIDTAVARHGQHAAVKVLGPSRSALVTFRTVGAASEAQAALPGQVRGRAQRCA